MDCFAFGAWQSFFWAGHRGAANSAADLRKEAAPPSFSKLLDDAKLRDWRGAVPKKAADEVRDLLRKVIQKIADTKSKNRRALTIAAVEECVRELNRIDEKHGPFICTIEREDLCDVLCSLLELAGVDSPEDIIDEQRDW